MAVDPRVIDYVKKELAAGYSVDQVKNALVKQGWFEHEVVEALKIVQGEEKEQPPQQKVKKAVIGFTLTLIGGVLFLLQGLSLLLETDIIGFVFSSIENLEYFLWLSSLGNDLLVMAEGLGLTLGMLGLFFAIIIILSSFLIFMGKEKMGAIPIIVLAIFGLVFGLGYVIGNILAIVGGVMGILKK